MIRRAFSLIELLVVIGIIMILVGILTWGYRHISAATSAKNTTVQLHACSGLLVEYESRVGAIKPDNSENAIERYGNRPKPAATIYVQGRKFPVAVSISMPPVYSDPFQSLVPGSVDPRIYLYESTNRTTDPGTDGTYWPCLAIADLQSPGKASDVADQTTPFTARYASAAVVNTWGVMSMLTQVPANASLVSKMPSERILEPLPEDGSATATPVKPILLVLDGWGNPIIFVPRAGMHVQIDTYTKDTSGVEIFVEYVVRSTGTFPATDFAKHPLSESDRPFFASAGEDGDFTKGNDNIYSFQE